MANLCHTKHFELSDNSEDIAGLLVDMQMVYDEPFADSSNIPTFLICELARQHVTVALGGDGADELLGGYVFWARDFLKSMKPAPAGPSLEYIVQRAMRKLANWLGYRTSKVTAGSALVHRYSHEFRNYFSRAERQQLGLANRDDHWIDYSRYHNNTISDMLRFDTDIYLPGDILTKTDRASMANSLELRAPFLDLDLASFCLSLPDNLKVNSEHEKLLLRHAYESVWTPEIRSRSKQGFDSPMARWLTIPAVSDLKHDVLGDRNQRIFNVLNFDEVQNFVDTNTQQTWSLLVLALWMERHACEIPES